MGAFKIFIYIIFCLLHISLFYFCLYLEKNRDSSFIFFMKYAVAFMTLLLLAVIFLHIRDNWNNRRLIGKLTADLNEARAKLFDYENPSKR